MTPTRGKVLFCPTWLDVFARKAGNGKASEHPRGPCGAAASNRMFMLCGPVRHAARLSPDAPHSLEVFPQRPTSSVDVAADATIQTAFAHLAQDPPWTKMIAAAIREQFGQGRKVPVLTERTDHGSVAVRRCERTIAI
ncbi:hypothetical protein OKW42_001240 [Paraburkholderia sp. WC7.3d]